MVDPHKPGVYNQNKKNKPNWVMIAILMTSVWFWVNMWFNGIFSSIIWLTIGTSIFTIILKLKGDI